jgi:CHAD domain-containing protein
MRVASRRLREALSLFDEWVDPVAGRKLQWYGRRVTKALGPVRNADVALRFFGALRKELRDDVERRAIQKILDRISRSRRKRRRAMMAAVKNLRLKRLSRDIDVLVAVPEIDESHIRPMLCELAQPLLRQRLESAFQYQAIVRDEPRWEELHRMRIAFKKARYALEILQPAFGQKYSKILKSLRGYQNLLGQIRDLDVFMEDLQRVSSRWREKRKSPTLRTALEIVVERLTHRRHNLLVEFCDYLNKHDSAVILQACDASPGGHPA